MNKKIEVIVGLSLLGLALVGCGKESSLKEYHEVDGRQGVACGEDGYFISGSTTLSYYDGDWNFINTNDHPFDDFTYEVNHIGDIDYYNGNVYAGVEYFCRLCADGVVGSSGSEAYPRCQAFDWCEISGRR